MAASPYNLRSKLHAQGVSLKTTSTGSPFGKPTPRSPQKSNGRVASLTLRTIIGTTTESQTGFSCHPGSDTFAFCAGSAVVLGSVDETGQVSQRFFRAEPISGACNPVVSVYDENTTGGTPDGRRKSALPTRSGALGFSVGATGSPRRDCNDESSSKPWTAKDRVKATTSISLSADGRFLAVGETGYRPRVLIFSTEKNPTVELPLSIITDHSFGVRAVSFSPDSRFLATLGDPNDGFLFVWSFDAKTGAVKLHSTNKCTANICDMTWCGDSLVTVGTRHVKVWRIPERLRTSPTKPRGRRLGPELLASPSPQALLGRNCLLGSLADATFTCVTAISSNEAIVCTDRGHVCLIGGTDNAQEIKVSKQLSFGIYAVTARRGTGQVLFGGVSDMPESEDCETIRCLARPARWPSSGYQSPASFNAPLKPLSPYSSPSRIVRRPRHSIIALGWLARHAVSIDSNFEITIIADDKETKPVSVKTFPSHRDPVQGLNILSKPSSLGSFFTWSPSGKVNFWDGEGDLQHSRVLEIDTVHNEDDGILNELRVVQATENAKLFVCGDRLGVLKVIKANDWSVLHEIRAHGTEITGVAIHEGSETVLIATCGRDRLVQLFALTEASTKDGILNNERRSLSETTSTDPRLESEAGFVELLQTMDDHVGAVGHVLFTYQGEQLLSCSADRTIIVRNRVMRNSGTTTSVAYLSSRIITLKSSPTTMAIVPGEKDILVVSTMDRQIVRLDISSGTQTESFKITDGEGDETAVMNSVQISKERSSKCPRLLVGSCSTDKSIRVYDYDQCVLLTRDSGHTEGISGLGLIESEDAELSEMKATVISTGLDGTIMIWDLSVRPPQSPSTPLQELSQCQALQICDSNGTPSRTPTAVRPPLRKVLSKTDLADFSFFDPITKSLTPVRDQSPPRIRKKTSRYSLAPNKLGLTDSPSLPPQKRSTTEDGRKGQADPVRNRSPSPPPIPPPRSQGPKQHSPANPAQRSPQASQRGELTRSPSPPPPAPTPMPKSTPTTPNSKTAERANNARPRRPPSVPSNLNSHANTPQTGTPRGRRKSLTPSATPATTTATPSNADPTTASATQSLSRSLRGYRKKISAAAAEQAREQLQLEEIETELLATLQSVREAKKARPKAMRSAPTCSGSNGGGSERGSRGGKAKAATEPNLDELTKLMERTGV